ncbi:hypothetical protein [Moritella sp. F3]|uniref:hypothetical protein n=1 Tax=Moritella sp. F3 TaxID=2718882 RepID=UPI0018E1B9B0|nr:hypothetical protein [Moritella sp. F3]GIC77135.1 hypothetical protein FMO001_18620 [Moritella sp. F1]GIC82254.1 hypothetical protein FMO003_25350 [Moritella sp. F3]
MKKDIKRFITKFKIKKVIIVITGVSLVLSLGFNAALFYESKQNARYTKLGKDMTKYVHLTKRSLIKTPQLAKDVGDKHVEWILTSKL